MRIISEKDEKILEKIKNEEEVCKYVRFDKFKLLVLYILFFIMTAVPFVGNVVDKNIIGIVSNGLIMIVFLMMIIENIVEFKKLKK